MIDIIGAFQKVIKGWRMWVWWLVLSVVIFYGLGLYFGWDNVYQFVFHGHLPLFTRVNILLTLWFGVWMHYPGWSFVILIMAILAFVLNLLYLFYILRQRELSVKNNQSVVGIIGSIIAFFGIGCATCGTALLAPLLTFLGLGSLYTILPWHGQELIPISLILILISIYSSSRSINKPAVCSIQSTKKS